MGNGWYESYSVVSCPCWYVRQWCRRNQHYLRTHFASIRMDPESKSGYQLFPTHCDLDDGHWGSECNGGAHYVRSASPPPNWMTIFPNHEWGEGWHEINEWGFELAWRGERLKVDIVDGMKMGKTPKISRIVPLAAPRLDLETPVVTDERSNSSYFRTAVLSLLGSFHSSVYSYLLFPSSGVNPESTVNSILFLKGYFVGFHFDCQLDFKCHCPLCFNYKTRIHTYYHLSYYRQRSLSHPKTDNR